MSPTLIRTIRSLMKVLMATTGERKQISKEAENELQKWLCHGNALDIVLLLCQLKKDLDKKGFVWMFQYNSSVQGRLMYSLGLTAVDPHAHKLRQPSLFDGMGLFDIDVPSSAIPFIAEWWKKNAKGIGWPGVVCPGMDHDFASLSRWAGTEECTKSLSTLVFHTRPVLDMLTLLKKKIAEHPEVPMRLFEPFDPEAMQFICSEARPELISAAGYPVENAEEFKLGFKPETIDDIAICSVIVDPVMMEKCMDCDVWNLKRLKNDTYKAWRKAQSLDLSFLPFPLFREEILNALGSIFPAVDSFLDHLFFAGEGSPHARFQNEEISAITDVIAYLTGIPVKKIKPIIMKATGYLPWAVSKGKSLPFAIIYAVEAWYAAHYFQDWMEAREIFFQYIGNFHLKTVSHLETFPIATRPG